MPDVYTWIAWAIAGLSLILGAQAFGAAGALLVVVLAILALTIVGATAGARARRALAKPDDRFQTTAELFRDPTTGRVTRVYADPRTGERRYRSED